MEKNELLNDHYLALFKNNCTSGDEEHDHLEADEILCNLLSDLGYTELVSEFRKLDKWYA
jgi:hypothetical protein